MRRLNSFARLIWSTVQDTHQTLVFEAKNQPRPVIENFSTEIDSVGPVIDWT